MTDYTLPIVPGARNRHTGRCRYCNAKVLWVLVGRVGRRKAGSWPFDREATDPRTVKDARGVAFEFWPATLLHRNTCTGAKPKPAAPIARPRFDPDGQGRLV